MEAEVLGHDEEKRRCRRQGLVKLILGSRWVHMAFRAFHPKSKSVTLVSLGYTICSFVGYSNQTTHLVTNIPHLKLIKVVFVNPVELFFFKIYLKLIFYIFRLFWRTVIKNKF
jgi:hypothetical protein